MSKYDCEMSKYLKAYFRANLEHGALIDTVGVMDIIKSKYRAYTPTQKYLGSFISFYLSDCLECVEEYNRKTGRTFKNKMGDRYGEQFKRKIIDGEVKYVFKDEFEKITGGRVKW